jgi:hypothetical protein
VPCLWQQERAQTAPVNLKLAPKKTVILKRKRIWFTDNLEQHISSENVASAYICGNVPGRFIDKGKLPDSVYVTSYVCVLKKKQKLFKVYMSVLVITIFILILEGSIPN